MNFTKFPRRQYIQGQTPIEFLPSLTKALGGDVIFIMGIIMNSNGIR